MKPKFTLFFLFLTSYILSNARLSLEIETIGVLSDSIGLSLNEAKQYSDTFCFNEVKTLYAHFDTSAHYSKIEWYRNDTLIESENQKWLKTKFEGTYYFIVIKNNRVHSYSRKKTLFAPQNANIKTSDNLRFLCMGEPLDMRAYPKMQKKYRWYYNDSLISKIATISNKGPGIYSAEVTMNNGCIDKDSMELFPTGIWLRLNKEILTPKTKEKIALKINLKNYHATTRYHVPLEIEIPSDFEILEYPNTFFSHKKGNTYYLKLDSIAPYEQKKQNDITIVYQLLNKNLCIKTIKAKVFDTSCYIQIVDSIVFHEDTFTKILIKRDETKLCTQTAAFLQSNISSHSMKNSFQWYKDSLLLPNQNRRSLATIEAGNYRLKMTSNSCSFLSNILLVKISAPFYSSAESKDNSCLGNFHGSIKVNTSGGWPPYSYLWNTNARENEINNIPAGQYQVSIKDQNNCQITKNIEVKNKKSISFKSKITATNNESQTYSIQFELDSNTQKPFFIQEVSKNIYFQSTDIYNIPKSYNQFKIIDYEGCESKIHVISH